MSDLDDAIREALSAEDTEFLEQLDEDLRFNELVRGVFKGPWGWPNIVLMVFVVPVVFLFVWATVRFLEAEDVREMLRWLSGAAITVAFLLLTRFWFGLSMQFNRVIRELKRLELQVARLAARSEGSAGE